MAARRYDELIAWQLAEGFKREVFRIVQSSSAAERDFKYRSQILDSASAVPKDIAQGFLRRSPADLARFIDYALGSLVEAEARLRDGVELSYFPGAECGEAFRFAKRCAKAALGLKHSQWRYVEKRRAQVRIERDRRRGKRKPRQRKEDDKDQPPRTRRT